MNYLKPSGPKTYPMKDIVINCILEYSVREPNICLISVAIIRLS